MRYIFTNEIFSKSAASFFVRFIGMVSGLGISLFLGNSLGPEGLGIINLSIRISSIFLVISMFGVENVLLKVISIAYKKNDSGSIISFLWNSIIFNGILSLIIIIIILLLSSSLIENIFKEPYLKIPLEIAMVAMLFQVISRIFQSAVNGFEKIWQSNLVNETLSSVFVGLIVLILLIFQREVSIINIALAYGASRIIVALTISGYFIRLFPKFFEIRKIKYKLPILLKPAMPLLVVNASSIISSNFDFVMLGWLSNAREIGIYSVGARIALLTSLFLQISNSVIAPKIATLFYDNKKKDLEVVVQKTTSVLILIAVFSLMIFIVTGNSILRLWGEEFQAAYSILIILAIGQLFNIGTGCSGLILTMCNEEKTIGRITLISVASNVVLNIILITYFGAIGAAIATATTVILENLVKLILVKRKVGIYTIPFIKNI